MSEARARVIDLFHDWDSDGSGTLDQREFRRAIRTMGCRVQRHEIDELFDTYDANASGHLDYNELASKLRRKVVLDEKLRAGAAGELDCSEETPKHAPAV